MAKLENFSVAIGFLIEIMLTFYFLMSSTTKIVDQCLLTFILKHQNIFLKGVLTLVVNFYFQMLKYF